MSDSKLVLVTGATGQQGGAVARALIAQGHRVRGLTRNVESDAAKTLTALGAEMVSGDFNDAATLIAAFKGVDAVFAMSTPFESGMESEVAQGVALIDAAVAASVPHFVYTSVASGNQSTGIPHFETKYEVEKHLAASGLRWTVIAPVFFMDNLLMPDSFEGLGNGVYASYVPEGLPLQQIAVGDIGAFGALVVSDPETFAGRRVEIAGDAPTPEQAAGSLSRVLGREVSPFQIPIDQIREFSEDFALMVEWFITTGYSVNIEELRASYPDVGWRDFSDWATEMAPVLV